MAVQSGADDGHGLLHHLRVDVGGATAAAAAGLTGRPGPVPRPTCPPLGVVPRADALVQDDDLRRKREAYGSTMHARFITTYTPKSL